MVFGCGVPSHTTALPAAWAMVAESSTVNGVPIGPGWPAVRSHVICTGSVTRTLDLATVPVDPSEMVTADCAWALIGASTITADAHTDTESNASRRLDIRSPLLGMATQRAG